MLATRSPQMRKAVGVLKELSADEQTRMLYESREMARRDIASQVDELSAALVKSEAALADNAKLIADKDTALADNAKLIADKDTELEVKSSRIAELEAQLTKLTKS